MKLRSFAGALVCAVAFPLFAIDLTPPVITPNVSGTLGNGNWYVSDVLVTWTVTDDESPVTIRAGCDPVLVTHDTPGEVVVCSAASLGGVATATYTVLRDTTGPVVGYNGTLAYTIDQQVAIFCNAFDSLSGVASSTCTDIVGTAFSFDVGQHTFSATATDNAGNQGSGSVTFTIGVTVPSLQNLVTQWVLRDNVARSLNRKLGRGDITGFIRTVNRETGKWITPEHAAELIRLAGLL
jgi:hypothetical protein